MAYDYYDEVTNFIMSATFFGRNLSSGTRFGLTMLPLYGRA